ncbi:MAG: hypothetical protein ACFCUU_16535 [Cyclobacteriaceae bacterium]
MKIFNKYTWIIGMAVLATLASCEMNDPLEDLGQEVGNVPFVALSGLRDLYPAGDDMIFNINYWSKYDDPQSLALLMEENVVLKGSLTVDDGGGNTTVNFNNESFKTELRKVGEDINHNPLDYETALNAYNKRMVIFIDPQFQMVSIKDAEEEALNSISDVARSEDIRSAIISKLESVGVQTSWAELSDIITEIDLAVESTLGLKIRVYNTAGRYNETTLRNVTVGSLAE